MRIGLTFDLRGEGSRRGSGGDDEDEEFDSPETIAAIADVLRKLGHEVELIGDGEEAVRLLLAHPRPDLVFNIAEGQGATRSREARLPALCELLGIPFTGSDPLTLAATLDKDCAKRLVESVGVKTPRWVLARVGELEGLGPDLAALGLPVIVKPVHEGSSKGIRSASLVRDAKALVPAIAEAHRSYQQPVLIEEFIDGDELTVGVIGNDPAEILGIMRVVPTIATGSFVYSLEVKRDWRRQVRYECPAELAPADTEAVRAATLAACRVLGVRDVGRVDFRLRSGVPYFLEVNPLPGLSPEYSDLMIMARAVGVSYPELIGRIVAAARTRLDLG